MTLLFDKITSDIKKALREAYTRVSVEGDTVEIQSGVYLERGSDILSHREEDLKDAQSLDDDEREKKLEEISDYYDHVKPFWVYVTTDGSTAPELVDVNDLLAMCIEYSK